MKHGKVVPNTLWLRLWSTAITLYVTLTLSSVLFVTVRAGTSPSKKKCEISAIENLCSRKLDQSSLMSLKICYTTMPLIVPNFVALGQTIYEKSVTNFLQPSVFWHSSGEPCVKVHWSRHWCTGRLPLSTCQFSSPCDNLSMKYLLPNFVDFVESVTDRPTKRSKRHVSAYHAAATTKQEYCYGVPSYG